MRETTTRMIRTTTERLTPSEPPVFVAVSCSVCAVPQMIRPPRGWCRDCGAEVKVEARE